MIRDDRFPVEPWTVRELGLDLGMLAQSESIFALSNGHLGVRGNLDEGDPVGLRGSYLNSFYERRPLTYAEAGYGYPESGQTVVSVTDGKLIRLLVDDEPFDMRYGTVLRHERELDLRGGVLHRRVEWSSPSGRQVRVHSTRLVSFTQRAVMAVHYQVEAVGQPVRVVVQSELIANQEATSGSADPRAAAVLDNPLQAEEHSVDGHRCTLVHRTRLSGLRLAVAADHRYDCANEVVSETAIHPDWSRTTVAALLEPGGQLSLTKFVGYGWSAQRSVAALRDQVEAALVSAMTTGWQGIVDEQRDYLDEFWDGADVQIDGSQNSQQAVRFGLFQMLQASARAEQRAIPAKGLTGPGYDGHAFWDTESFVLPVLTATSPQAAADALRWRHSTLELAVERAGALNQAGAAFPWRTIRGEECGAYWPAGTAAVHVNADIAMAAVRHVRWTADADFERDCALDLLVHTARLWMSLGYQGGDGEFHLDGVTGPDEYSALVDDNTYTNLMAAANLRQAAEVAERWPEQAAALGLSAAERAGWLTAASRISRPYNAELGLPEQHRDATRAQRWDFQASADSGGYPLLLHAPYFEIYRKQVVKQADLVLAMHWCGDEFSDADKAAAFAYYEQLTVRDSSLSACTQAVLAAEVGHLDLALDYLHEAAMMDLHDLEHNTRDGLHIASLAGSWLALVCGFGGMRDYGGRLSFAPRLPHQLSRLRFAVRWRECKVRVDIDREQVSYQLQNHADAELELCHHGTSFALRAGRTVQLPVPPITPPGERPSQPAGRAPNAE